MLKCLWQTAGTMRGFSVVPWINDQITGQVYEPVLAEVEQLPPGLITSIYAPLRSYLKKHHPDLFAKMREAVENTRTGNTAFSAIRSCTLSFRSFPPKTRLCCLTRANRHSFGTSGRAERVMASGDGGIERSAQQRIACRV
jgi:hypothetical protein